MEKMLFLLLYPGYVKDMDFGFYPPAFLHLGGWGCYTKLCAIDLCFQKPATNKKSTFLNKLLSEREGERERKKRGGGIKGIQYFYG